METWRDTDKHVIRCVPSQLPDWQPLHRLRGLPRVCGGLTATAEMAGWTGSLQVRENSGYSGILELCPDPGLLRGLRNATVECVHTSLICAEV